MKLKVFISFVICMNEWAFEARGFIDEVTDRRQANRIANECGGIVKAYASCLLDNDTDKASEFGYGDTVPQAKKSLREWLHKY